MTTRQQPASDAHDVGPAMVGTSGWHYDDWRGIVYPTELPKSAWLEHYATLFDTVELNNPFYRLPTEAAVAGWRDRAPEGFRYAVKGSRFTTHNLKIGGDRLGESVQMVCGRMRPLAGRMVAMLWQLPPNLHVDVERLARFVGMLPDWTRHAVEFRHPSWSTAAVDDVLAAHGVARVWVSDRGQDQPTTRTSDVVYLRFHGLGPESYHYDYSDAELDPWVQRVADAVTDGCLPLVYFNNDWYGHAVTNARRFSELLALRVDPEVQAQDAGPPRSAVAGRTSRPRPRPSGS